MANPQHLEILKRGVNAWNKWRDDDFSLNPDLSNISLKGFELFGASLYRTNLSHSDMSNMWIVNSDLKQTELSGTNFAGSHFISTDLSFAHMSETNLNFVEFHSCIFDEVFMLNVKMKGNILSSVRFYNTKFSNTDLTGSSIGNCIFAYCDLSKAIGLETLDHMGASDIGVGTFYESKGNINEIFVRKAGIPEDFITYSKSLVTKPIEFYSCFISFTEKDDLFSERLYNDMQGKGIRCWRWKEDAKWGKTLRKSIDEAVRVYDKLVVICSKDSLNSPAVIEEIERALNKEDAQIREGKESEVLFPITIDDYIFNGWDHYLKARLLRKTVGDFKGWRRNPGKYKKSVERLVKDLNMHS